MEVGIVGLPGVGKSTLFQALTGQVVEAFAEKTNVGMANVPDPRLGRIAEYVTTRKVIPATLKLVDIPGVPVGGDTKKLNRFLEQIRQVDAICHVVRCFDPGTGAPAPASDIEKMETELVLADLVVAESAREKATRNARSGEREAKERLALLEKLVTHLEEGKAVATETEWTDAEAALIRSYGLITAKPIVYVANVAEEADPAVADAVSKHADAVGSVAVPLCARLEAELAELDEADRGEMLESLGLAEPAIGPLARAAHRVLGLTTFYTAGDKEVRAWTIPLGAVAPEAAGAIHSDIQRGFIRAECYGVDDLFELHSEKAIREAGRLRSEGKHYEMQEGDVVHFLFNV
ncbi:MAG: redox-regulated ATPase YchF [Phycisphaerales bacterium]|nr:redox-regulated ATPase YchF [Phycisphaerae bacterium]NNF41665.1 redox-regulated ATPase YchF [Phycisphaerales bacterium]NNM27613.1 redox-regulated ATPase YchF [Phycisphaerales bacterium]